MSLVQIDYILSPKWTVDFSESNDTTRSNGQRPSRWPNSSDAKEDYWINLCLQISDFLFCVQKRFKMCPLKYIVSKNVSKSSRLRVSCATPPLIQYIACLGSSGVYKWGVLWTLFSTSDLFFLCLHLQQ